MKILHKLVLTLFFSTTVLGLTACGGGGGGGEDGGNANNEQTNTGDEDYAPEDFSNYKRVRINTRFYEKGSNYTNIESWFEIYFESDGSVTWSRSDEAAAVGFRSGKGKYTCIKPAKNRLNIKLQNVHFEAITPYGEPVIPEEYRDLDMTVTFTGKKTAVGAIGWTTYVADKTPKISDAYTVKFEIRYTSS